MDVLNKSPILIDGRLPVPCTSRLGLFFDPSLAEQRAVGTRIQEGVRLERTRVEPLLKNDLDAKDQPLRQLVGRVSWILTAMEPGHAEIVAMKKDHLTWAGLVSENDLERSTNASASHRDGR